MTLRLCCHTEVSSFLALIRTYDVLWHNSAKNNVKNQVGLLFSSVNHVTDEHILTQIHRSVQRMCSWLHFCRLEATSPNKGGNSTEIQPLLMYLPTDWILMASPLLLLWRRPVAEKCISPAVTLQEIGKIGEGDRYIHLSHFLLSF